MVYRSLADCMRNVVRRTETRICFKKIDSSAFFVQWHKETIGNSAGISPDTQELKREINHATDL